MIKTAEMLEVFQHHRGQAIVIPGRGGRLWVDISKNPNLDLPLGDPAMGGCAAFALGLALAQPERKVVVFDSEGDLQMGLGVLAMIAEQQPKNLYHFLLDNECYATTGGQPVPNAKTIAYDAIARASGYPRTHALDTLEGFAVNIEAILAAPGPVFVAMKVVPEIQNEPIAKRRKWQTRTRLQMIADLKKELGLSA
jgi:thiamine pyrophosphate-dependent acetolactate synthase large subunit-like protein